MVAVGQPQIIHLNFNSYGNLEAEAIRLIKVKN